MLKTEMRNPKTTHLDRMTTAEMLRVIQEENMNAVKAVDGCLDAVGRAVDAVTEALRKGGRLIYVGAGTSGRLGVLDASEACPTFGVPEGTILGVMAGGVEALYRAGEPEEDSAAFGERDVKAANLAAADCVVGISAAGGAEYVLGALGYAKSLGCATVGLTCNEGSPLAKGNVYENMMVNLKPSNDKLRERMVRIVSDVREVELTEARRLLEENGWSIREILSKK